MNLLAELVDAARQTVASGYYVSHGNLKRAPSLAHAIRDARSEGRTVIVAEVKTASPTRGRLLEGGIEGLVASYVADGAIGLSAVTEPQHFHGSLSHLRKAVATGRPVLMKDFIVDETQIDCAAELGASAVLLIAAILPRKRMETLIEYAHMADREVLVEVTSRKEYDRAAETSADMIGINNRDLRTFQVDLARTREVAEGVERDRPLLSMSGISSREDIERLQPYVDGFLVGSSLVDGSVSLRELVGG